MKTRTLLLVVVLLALCAGMALGQTQQQSPVFQPAQTLTAPKAPSVEELVAQAGGNIRPMGGAVSDGAAGGSRLLVLPLVGQQVVRRGETLIVDFIPFDYNGTMLLYGWYTPTVQWGEPSREPLPVRAKIARDGVLRGGVRAGELLNFIEMAIPETAGYGKHSLEVSVVEPGVGSQKFRVNFCVLYCDPGENFLRNASITQTKYGPAVLIEGRFNHGGTTFPIVVSNVPSGGYNTTVYFANPSADGVMLILPAEMQWGKVVTTLYVTALFPDGTISGTKVLWDGTVGNPVPRG